MPTAAAEIPTKRIDPWKNVFPYRLVMDKPPRGSFYDRTHPLKNLGSNGPHQWHPNGSFRIWAKKHLRGRYQFIFWGDIREAMLLMERGEAYPEMYGVAFENRRDAINYKLWWG